MQGQPGLDHVPYDGLDAPIAVHILHATDPVRHNVKFAGHVFDTHQLDVHGYQKIQESLYQGGTDRV